ncbi:protein of unknown function [Cribrihabitans marinus]|uniref:DUF4336 domain-containing protein n=1 Tax=Cribrihabitans marinus TaxID=1227549 RepID=A0A1H6QY19_9RHOB|nr:DUF4336 domain-containing protein [Cribrihabitans marinus]GGH20121.1 hypothetical protein GCM10010973_03850 [Cribrihabitans marinus]SEI48509.1 protein of unknown function [Cribrihabitans marinus]
MASDALLQPIGPEIWLANGPEIRFYGIPFPTRMTVIRLADGDLFLHSPIAHSAELESELRALGRIRHLVSPNWIHYAHIGTWAEAVPDSIAWASPGVRERAAKQGDPVAFDRDLDDAPDPGWQDEIDQMIVRGSRVHREVVFFHRPSRVLILTDLIENMHTENMPLWLRPLARLGGIVAPNGKMPLDMWLSFSGHRDTLARALGRMLDWNPTIVVLAHGDILRENVPERLRAGFRGLAPLGPAE